MVLNLLIAFHVIFLLGCSVSQKAPNSSILGFDIDQETNQIYYVLSSDKVASVRRLDLTNKTDSILFVAQKGDYIFGPKLSGDKTKITFIRNNKENGANSQMGQFNLNTEELSYLPTPEGIISSYTYSKFTNDIYFLLAKEFGHYSPIGVDQPHKFDLYQLNLERYNCSKISDLGAYSMYELIETDSQRVAFYMMDGDRNGIYEIEIGKSNLGKIEPIEDVRTNFYVYGKNEQPVYSHVAMSNKLGLTAIVCGYELFVMDTNGRNAKSIYTVNRHFSKIQFLENPSPKIVFTKDKDPHLYFLGLSDNELHVYTPKEHLN